MPHANEDGGGTAGEDACSSDELIVFKDEDGGEDVVKRSSDKVTEEKSDLIDLSESEVSSFFIFYFKRVHPTWLLSVYRNPSFPTPYVSYRTGRPNVDFVRNRSTENTLKRLRADTYSSSRRLLKSQIIKYLFVLYPRLQVQLLLNNPEGLFHVEQVKTGVTPLLNPSHLRRPETRDYNNGPPLNTHTHELWYVN